MAYNDFFYIASQVFTSGVYHPPYRLASNRGQTGSDKGAYAAALTPKLNSSYSGTAIPNSVGSTHARYMDYGSGTNSASDITYIAGCFVSSSADSSNIYPITSSIASDGIGVAESLRAFVRIDGSANSRGGVTIGLVARNRSYSQATMNTSTNYQHNSINTTGDQHSTNANSVRYITKPPNMGGYNLVLSTVKRIGDHPANGGSGGAGLNGVPELRLVAHKQAAQSSNFSSNTNDVLQRVSTDAKAFNTWYHIRMDIIPSLAGDTIKVYTAPVTGAGSAAVAGIGSETWTEDTSLSTSVSAAEPWYRAPGGELTGNASTDSALHQWSGWWSGASQYSAADDQSTIGAVSIDRFQMINKVITS